MVAWITFLYVGMLALFGLAGWHAHDYVLSILDAEPNGKAIIMAFVNFGLGFWLITVLFDIMTRGRDE